MKDFNDIDHYVIDDEDIAEVPKKKEVGGNRSAREIVFDTDEI